MAITREQFLAMPGARQYEPGIFTNDAGEFYDAQGNPIADPGIGMGQSDNPGGPGYQGGNNPPGYTGYGAPQPESMPWTPLLDLPAPDQPTAPTAPAPTGSSNPNPIGPSAGPTGPTGPTPDLPSTPTAPAFTPPPAFTYDPFNAPDPNSLVNDKRYQFQLSQGLGAIGHKAAAMGTLNTGGTLGDYVGYAENLANTSYKDLYNQDFNTYQANRSNAFDAYKTNYGIGKDVYDTNYQTQYADPFSNANTIAMERYGADANNYGLNQTNTQFYAGLNQNQNQFGQTLAQNQSQFGATLAQQDKLAQQQFGLSYAQLDAQKKQAVDALAQNQSQFDTSTKQNASQFGQTMDFNRWLEDYKRSVLDPFDQRYKTLGLL